MTTDLSPARPGAVVDPAELLEASSAGILGDRYLDTVFDEDWLADVGVETGQGLGAAGPSDPAPFDRPQETLAQQVAAGAR